MVEITGDLIVKIVVAGFGCVGVEEWIKNFLPEKRSKWWALLMLPLSIGCFFAVHCMPLPVIDSVLTVGTVQIAYETLIQGFRAVIERVSGKVRDDSGRGEWRRDNAPPTPPDEKGHGRGR